jgi:hypothetical protein
MFVCWCGSDIRPTRKQVYDAIYADEPPMVRCSSGHETPLRRGEIQPG